METLCASRWCLMCLIAKAGSIVICVSPLTSLMLDQQQNFSRYGLATEFVGEAQEDP